MKAIYKSTFYEETTRNDEPVVLLHFTPEEPRAEKLPEVFPKDLTISFENNELARKLVCKHQGSAKLILEVK